MDNKAAKSGPTKSTPRPALGRGLSALISTPPVALVPPVILATPQATGSTQTSDRGFEARAGARQQYASSANLALSTDNVQPVATDGASVSYIAISAVAPNPKQPRQDFSEAELAELAASLKSVGLLQPILVRPTLSGASEEAALDSRRAASRYEIVAGERRWRAAQKAGLLQVPVIIRDLDDRETLELALIENVQRENLNPVEHALAYQRLMQEFNLSQNEIAERVGKDRASVANYLRLLKLPEEVLGFIRKNELSMGHAKAILTVKEPTAQLNLARKVLKEALSVRDLESIVSRVVVLDTGRRQKTKSGRGGYKGAFPEVVDRMRNALGTKVAIKHGKSGSGRIEIEYFSEEELDRLSEHLCRS